MRRICYQVASSLDGYIAGPNGEFDWIPAEPEIDFAEILSRFDTLLIGARTFEFMLHHGQTTMPGMKMFVFSHTLKPEDYPHVTVVSSEPAERVRALREQPGKDIWIFGGGVLFRTFLDAGLVDKVEVIIIPVLLGGGIPLLPPISKQIRLELTGHKVYGNGVVSLEYAIA